MITIIKLCSNCNNEAKKGGRYCLQCHAEYMREWRKTHPLTPMQRFKDTSRSYAGVYKRRGKLIPKPCEVCGSENAQAHHDDYSKPVDVRWLCKDDHQEHHNKLRLHGKH